MSNIKYDENGGIVSLEDQGKKSKNNKKKHKKGYNFLERFILSKSKKLNYLLDKNGKYKCRSENTPSVIRIGPTNLCTAQCTYCPREHIHAGGCGYMKMDDFERIVAFAEKNHVMDMSFALFGEPLIHPQIFEMMDLARSKGLRVGISSNAIVMDKNKSRNLIDLELESIEMSLDGYDRHEYEDGKQVKQYSKAKRNIEYLLSYAREKESKTRFNVHFVDAGNVSKKNKRKFVKYWSEKLKGLEHVTSFYYEPHNWAGTRPDMRVTWSMVDRLFSKLELRKPCVYVKGMNIDWNGDVYVCTNDPTKSAVLGNIRTNSFEDIYNGEKRMEYLSAHETGDYKELNCANCNVNSYWPLLFIKKRIFNFFSRH